MSLPAILRVAINAPLSRLFDYLPPVGAPPHPEESLLPGCRITVPFGRREQTAVIVAHADKSEVPADKLRRAISAIDTAPVLNESDLWLVKFASNYYQHPIGEVVAAALPAPLRHGKPLNPIIRKIRISNDGAAIDIDTLSKRAPKQAHLLAAIQDAVIIGFDELDARQPGWRTVRKALLDKGWVTVEESAEEPPVSGTASGQAGHELNSDQSDAVSAIRNVSGFQVSLLDGVTGSGKTEVYLTLMRDEIAAGRQVLILVPEIGLTPQLVSRLATRLGEEPAAASGRFRVRE